MKDFDVQAARELYGVDSWGADYFNIDNTGFLTVSPTKSLQGQVRVKEIVDELKNRDLQLPLILRFPQILSAQITQLADAFQRAIIEYGYENTYSPVFPIKVNQRYNVVSPLLEAGASKHIGIEVGSKPELCAALGMLNKKPSIIICNGFKDKEYFETASLAAEMGQNIVTVIEKPFELKALHQLKLDGKKLPGIGFRIKLNAKGSGLWEKSGGSASKFGLSANQLIQAITFLEDEDMLSELKMFHFHIGSQITEIRRIKEAIKEAARIYAKVKKGGVDIKYLNVGGGLGVDYDGSKTSSDASVNYGVNEYANDVVYTISEVCENEKVTPPQIISESGRYLVAYHSMLIIDMRDQYHEMHTEKPEPSEKEAPFVEEVRYIYENISVKNYREYFHDALEKKEEMKSLFNLGMLSIEDRAKCEWYYWGTAKKAVTFGKTAKFMADEFVELEQELYEKIVGNFSVFQSIPDQWALDQLFPVMPIAYLEKCPTRKATIVDITCDSDGEVDKFVDLRDIKQALEIHDTQKCSPYYLAFMMIGAYQDTMGDLHNLFGAVNEAEILVSEDGTYDIQAMQKGDSVKDTLDMYGYKEEKLLSDLRKHLSALQAKEVVDEQTAQSILKRYTQVLNSYPYLVEDN